MADVATLRRMAIRPVEHAPVRAVVSGPVYPGAALSTPRLVTLANHVIAAPYVVETLLLKGRRRGGRRLAHARTVAMALVHLVCGRSQEDVAQCMGGRNRTTASHHMEMIEWLNDIPEHEAFWNLLCQRFEALIVFDSLPSGRDEWMAALRALRRECGPRGQLLEGDAILQAKHVVGVFWEERFGA